MKLQAKHLIATAGVAGIAAGLTGLGGALVSADTSSASGTQPRNGIAVYTMRYDRLTAMAEVLNTTPQQLQNQLKTETMQQVITAAGFTKVTFHQKVKAQLKTDLLNQGYSQTQINNALNRKHKNHGNK